MTDWKKYSKMIIRKKRLVMLITLVFVLLGTFLSLFIITPKYEASSQLMARISSNDRSKGSVYEDLVASQLLIKSYKDLIMSRAVTSEVIQNLQLKMTDEDLAASVVVELIPDSSMFRIKVRNESSVAVVNITNEVSAVFIQKASKILQTDNFVVVDKAKASEKPVSPRPMLILGFSFLVGIMLSLGLILVLIFFDDSIGDLKEIEKKTGLRVVGIIPDMKIKIGV